MLAATFAGRRAHALAARSANGIAGDLDVAARAALKAGACPGIALQIARHGQTLYAKPYGWSNLETDTPVAAGSVFRIGSITKQFTAALVVKLAAQGRLSLDAPAAAYLPFFPDDRPFTVRELLNHTAGLHDGETPCPCGSATAKSQLDLARDIAAQKKLFDFAPGTAWLYSNTNYVVLGAVVEKVTGLPLAEAAASIVFRPLGLPATAFDTVEAVVPGRVDGYSPVDGKPGTFAHAAYIDVAQAGGAGAVRSDTGDLCRWHHALFANRLFDAGHVRLMTTPGRLRDGRPSGSHRFSPADDRAYGDVQYGMGFLLPPPVDGHRSVMHYGFIDGFAGCLETYPDQGLTLAILCNADMGPGIAEAFRDLRRIVRKKLLPASAAP